jgi:hypothetical protein
MMYAPTSPCAPFLRAINAEAIVLDLMQPLPAGRQFIGFGWKARRDEPGQEGTHTYGL